MVKVTDFNFFFRSFTWKASVPQVKETQERLRACSYSFAHPETVEMVPGCV
jgi:hypothetical protein